jgi:hypothetical protein
MLKMRTNIIKVKATFIESNPETISMTPRWQLTKRGRGINGDERREGACKT